MVTSFIYRYFIIAFIMPTSLFFIIYLLVRLFYYGTAIQQSRHIFQTAVLLGTWGKILSILWNNQNIHNFIKDFENGIEDNDDCLKSGQKLRKMYVRLVIFALVLLIIVNIIMRDPEASFFGYYFLDYFDSNCK